MFKYSIALVPKTMRFMDKGKKCCLYLLLFQISYLTMSSDSLNSLPNTAVDVRISPTLHLPKFSDTDMIELYHLRSFPLFLIETAAGSFSTQTSGLALRSTTTSEIVVLDFQPMNYSACFLPKLISYDNNITRIEWDKRAKVNYCKEIDTLYWQQSTFLARINGVVYKRYIRWVEKYTINNEFFIPQSICSRTDELSCFSFAETWETFLADSFEKFSQLSVRINAIIPPRGKEIRVLSFTEPIEFQLTYDNDVSSHESEGVVVPSSSPTSNSSPNMNSTTVDEDSSNNNNESNDINDNHLRRHHDNTDDHDQNGNNPSDASSGTTIPSDPSASNQNDTVAPMEHKSRLPTDDNNGFDLSVPTFLPTDLNQDTDIEGDPPVIHRRPPSTDTNYRSLQGFHLELSVPNDVDNNDQDPTTTKSHLSPEDIQDREAIDIFYGIQNNNKNANKKVVHWSEVVEYYSNLISCMEEYQLEDFTNALQSCMTERIGYLHKRENIYYKIKPRHPYVYVHEYLHTIPDPQYQNTSNHDLSTDRVIGIMLIIMACIGLIYGLYRMNVYELCFHSPSTEYYPSDYYAVNQHASNDSLSELVQRTHEITKLIHISPSLTRTNEKNLTDNEFIPFLQSMDSIDIADEDDRAVESVNQNEGKPHLKHTSLMVADRLRNNMNWLPK